MSQYVLTSRQKTNRIAIRYWQLFLGIVVVFTTNTAYLMESPQFDPNWNQTYVAGQYFQEFEYELDSHVHVEHTEEKAHFDIPFKQFPSEKLDPRVQLIDRFGAQEFTHTEKRCISL